MHLQPRSDILWIRRLPPQDMSSGGIVLAYDADFKEDIGIVEAKGPGKLYGCRDCGNYHRREVEVNVGDKVIFSTNGHQVVNVNQQEYIVCREPSVMAVIQ